MRKTYIVYADSMQDAVRKVRKMRKDAVKKSRKIGDGDFYGVPGIKYISHGDWGDPEVEYKGVRFNYYDLEDGLWDEYKEEMEEQGKKATDDGFEAWIDANHDRVYEDADYLADYYSNDRVEDSKRTMRKPVAKRPAIRKDSVSRNRRVARRHR